MESSEYKVQLSEEDWQKKLTQKQFLVLRKGETDAPFTGEYVNFHEDGLFTCAACGSELFSSGDKYDSRSGWPSFTKPVAENKIKLRKDTSHDMIRTEALCGSCGSHLGHLFDDGPGVEGQRWCINSTSLEFNNKNT